MPIADVQVPALISTSGARIPYPEWDIQRRDVATPGATVASATSIAQSLLSRPNTQVLRNLSESPWVRAALRRRAEQVTSAVWALGPRDPDRPFDERIAADVENLLRNPNRRRDSWRTLMGPAVIDYHVIGWGSIEKEQSARRIPVALYHVDSSKVIFDAKWDGSDPEAPRYWFLRGVERVPLRNDQLVTFLADPETWREQGLSTLAILAREIEAELTGTGWAHDHLRHQPPSGMIDLGKGANQQQVDTFRAAWRREIAGHAGVAIVGGTEGSKWTAFTTQTGRDLIEWQVYFVRKICAAFQLSPQELGVTFDVNRATAEVQADISVDAGLRPLLLLWQEYINREILADFGDLERLNLEFRFTELNQTDRTKTAELVNLQNGGVPRITINEARAEDGYEPVEGGDVIVALVPGKGVVPILGAGVPTPAEQYAATQAQEQLNGTDTDAADGDAVAPDAATGTDAEPGTGRARRRPGALASAPDGAPSRVTRSFPAARASIRRTCRLAYVAYARERTARILADARTRLDIARDLSDSHRKQEILLALRWAVEREVTRERLAAGLDVHGGLTDVLLDTWTASVEQALTAELAKLGVERDVTLSDPALIAEIRQLVIQRAESILHTLGADAAAWWDNLPDDVAPEDALSQFSAWMDQRDQGKAGVIANAESQAAAAYAVRQFVRRNGLEGEGRCVPETAECEDCRDLVDQSWVTLDDALGWALPAHPRCPHEVETRYADGTDTGGLWAG